MKTQKQCVYHFVQKSTFYTDITQQNPLIHIWKNNKFELKKMLKSADWWKVVPYCRNQGSISSLTVVPVGSSPLCSSDLLLPVCLHCLLLSRHKWWEFAAAGTAVQTQVNTPKSERTMKRNLHFVNFNNLLLFIGMFAGLCCPCTGDCTSNTILHWELQLCLFLTSWHFDQILTCHVSKDCCPAMFEAHRFSVVWKTPTVQRHRLRQPHFYRLIKQALRSPFMCSDQPTPPASMTTPVI